jgi:secreted trypsin-like serine protease
MLKDTQVLALILLVSALTACSTAPVKPSVPTPVTTEPAVAASLRTIQWDRFESAVILKTWRAQNSYICSAVLIGPDRGLTTAHCIAHSDRNEVLLGKSTTDPTLQTVEVLPQSVHIHPGYHPDRSLSDSDIAVFRLKKPVSLKIFPRIADADAPTLQPGQPLDRVGFGMRNGQNARTWTEVFFQSQEKGRLIVRDLLSVNGDSGSPLYLTTENGLYLLGLHSTLVDGGNVATVHVPDFKRWIFRH